MITVVFRSGVRAKLAAVTPEKVSFHIYRNETVRVYSVFRKGRGLRCYLSFPDSSNYRAIRYTEFYAALQYLRYLSYATNSPDGIALYKRIIKGLESVFNVPYNVVPVIRMRDRYALKDARSVLELSNEKAPYVLVDPDVVRYYRNSFASKVLRGIVENAPTYYSLAFLGPVVSELLRLHSLLTEHGYGVYSKQLILEAPANIAKWALLTAHSRLTRGEARYLRLFRTKRNQGPVYPILEILKLNPSYKWFRIVLCDIPTAEAAHSCLSMTRNTNIPKRYIKSLNELMGYVTSYMITHDLEVELYQLYSNPEAVIHYFTRPETFIPTIPNRSIIYKDTEYTIPISRDELKDAGYTLDNCLTKPKHWIQQVLTMFQGSGPLILIGKRNNQIVSATEINAGENYELLQSTEPISQELLDELGTLSKNFLNAFTSTKLASLPAPDIPT